MVMLGYICFEFAYPVAVQMAASIREVSGAPATAKDEFTLAFGPVCDGCRKLKDKLLAERMQDRDLDEVANRVADELEKLGLKDNEEMR